MYNAEDHGDVGEEKERGLQYKRESSDPTQ